MRKSTAIEWHISHEVLPRWSLPNIPTPCCNRRRSSNLSNSINLTLYLKELTTKTSSWTLTWERIFSLSFRYRKEWKLRAESKKCSSNGRRTETRTSQNSIKLKSLDQINSRCQSTWRMKENNMRSLLYYLKTITSLRSIKSISKHRVRNTQQ